MQSESEILFGMSNACIIYLIHVLEILQDNTSVMYFYNIAVIYHVKRKMSFVLET